MEDVDDKNLNEGVETMSVTSALTLDQSKAFVGDMSLALPVVEGSNFKHDDFKKDNFLFDEGVFLLADFHCARENPGRNSFDRGFLGLMLRWVLLEKAKRYSEGELQL